MSYIRTCMTVRRGSASAYLLQNHAFDQALVVDLDSIRHAHLGNIVTRLLAL